MKIYITGHRNPDMDSVAAAYSYSVLKNQIDSDNEYIPVMLGPAGKRAKKVFGELGISLPRFLHDVRPRVGEVAREPRYSVASSDSLYSLMDIFMRYRPSVVPVIDDGEYKGLLASDDINAFFLRENRKGGRLSYLLSEENIGHTIEGKYIKTGSISLFRAPCMVGAMEYGTYIERLDALSEKPVLVIGYRKNHIEAAIERGLPGIVLTGISSENDIDIDFSDYPGFVYLSSVDTAETIRRLRLSTPVQDIIPEEGEDRHIDADMLFDDAKKKLQESEYRGLSVFRNGKWIGFVTRRCFLDKPRQKLILVDHNEPEQSVVGIEDADVIEIIDHHRLSPPRMTTPIYIVSNPLGSTCSIIYEQFRKWGIDIDRTTARIMLSGLVSDTVMLKSPTTTAYDEHVARRLCAIGGIESFEEYCSDLFSGEATLGEQDPIAAIESDLKAYNESGVKFAIGQVEVVDLSDALSSSARYIKALEEVRAERSLDWAMLMVSDVVRGNSLLFATEHEKETSLPYERIAEGVYDLPEVLSRKKQLLPSVLRALG